jgi:hypothetical protein
MNFCFNYKIIVIIWAVVMLNTILPTIHIVEFWQDLEGTVCTDDAPFTLTNTNMDLI